MGAEGRKPRVEGRILGPGTRGGGQIIINSINY